jgi:sulfite reductase (NADPH) hemoprotein beta-component
MITESAPKLTRNEGLKAADPLLAGTIAVALADESLDHFSEDDYEFLKFHGVYQQDDRDKRKTGKAYSMMVRTKFPGGVLSAEQYVACDGLSTAYGNGTMRITTRQDFQFHGVLKNNLRATIRALNEALITTIAACGDVQRNVMAPPTPSRGPLSDLILAQAKAVSNALAPVTPAYHSIWVEGKELDLGEVERAAFVDPLYGKSYLPRKFKVGFAIPPLNDVDVYTHDLGFIAVEENGILVGYNLLAGGGLGMSHNNPATFPRLADVVGFIEPEHLVTFSRAVVTIHRDFGDRTNRKHARLKYVIHERGVDWFKAELERRAGVTLQPARPFEFVRQGDLLGWHQQSDGRYFLGLFVENGRVADSQGYALKSALREVVETFRPEVRLTPSQNILLINIPAEDRAGIDQALAAHGLSASNPFSRTRRASMACPALPTCGLALAESERALPDLLTQIEMLLAEMRLQDEEIVIRMTGCPNGCARPYMAELAFVGKAPNKYQIYLGGNEASTRLNRLYKDSVKADEIIAELRQLFLRFFKERQPGERFGDFCARAVVA